MSERDEESLGRLLRRLARQQPSGKSPMECPGDENLAAYLDGGLAEIDRSKLESHLTDCRFCLDELVAAHTASQQVGSDAVPAKVSARAMALFPESKPMREIFKLVIELARDSLELISTSGRLVMPAAAAAIRGKEKAADSSVLRIESELEKFHVAVEVERLDNNLCQVVVNVTPKAKDGVADGLRLSLMSGEREQASYLARQGSAIFDRIPPGDYQLTMTAPGGFLGAIELSIKENGHERERKTD